MFPTGKRTTLNKSEFKFSKNLGVALRHLDILLLGECGFAKFHDIIAWIQSEGWGDQIP